MSVLADRRPIVLIVEDDAPTRDLLRTVLGARFKVITAADGLEALHRLETERPAVIVLDLGLPLLDGRDVARELAAHGDTARIPIVVVTGRDRINLREGDAAAVLRKPVDPEDLLEAVEASLRFRAQAL